MTENLFNKYIDAGFSIIPINRNKQPTIPKWTHLQKQKPTNQEVAHWFGNGNKPHGVAIIAGEVSGNLEIFDIDCKYDLSGSLMDDFCDLVKEHNPELLKRLVIAKTVNSGYHLLFRSATIQGNQKLAERLATDEEKEQGDKRKVLIETRGEGGYFAVYPTPGYQFTQGDLPNIPMITDAERDLLFIIARSFDQMPIKTDPQEVKTAKATSNGTSPFEDYNIRADFPALLEKHGWKFVYERSGRMHYKRPGNTDSKTSANYDTARGIFYVFSTSTEFEAERGYNPTQVYTILEYGGDYSEASKALYSAGYGLRHTKQETSSTQQSDDEIIFRGDPKPLDLTHKPVEEIDKDNLPKVLTDWLYPASRVIGCPVGFLVLSAIVFAGSLIGSRLRLKPLKHSDWFVVPNLYAGIVGLPSTKKTPALDETRKPILELQAKARKEFDEKLKDFVIESKYYERETTAIYRNKELGLEAIKNKIKSVDEPDKAILKRFETNDITAPKLVQFLAENPNGLTLFRDELAGWLKSLDAEYNASARPFFLELWKGAISYELARVDGREIQVNSGTVSIIGGVQPSKLQRYVAEAYSVENSDGFLQRFLFYFPDLNRVLEKPTKSDYEQMRKGFKSANEVFKELAENDFEGKVVSANGDKFHAVCFSNDTQKIADQWKEEIENEAKALETEDEPFSAFLSKLPKNCFAIALIFHTLEHINEKTFPDEISETTILRAISFTETLLSHARRVFSLGENQIFALAEKLVSKIKKSKLPYGFTVREVGRKQWSGLTSKETVLDVLSVLVDYNYLSENKSVGTGRPTTRFYIHPTLRKTENEN